MTEWKAVLCGNPNVGKSTVFNALTGLHQHTGNWAGKTVESAKGTVRDEEGTWTLIDLPGAYSLLNGSPDEMVTADYLLFREYDAAIVVCDATCLSRSLVLAQQVGRLCQHTVVCVNLMDEARHQGIGLDVTRLEKELGLPVVAVSARNGQGLKQLKRLVRQMMHQPKEMADEKRVLTNAEQPLSEEQRMLLVLQKWNAWPEGTESVRKEEVDVWKEQITKEDFHRAAMIADGCTYHDETNPVNQRRLLVDRILCHPVMGVLLMLALLLLLFYLTMFGANVPSQWLSKLLFGLESDMAVWFQRWNAPDWLTGAVVHGMYRTLAWVVAVMLPPMAIFFPLFTLLEDLGYLPRIAFNMDRCFHGCRACGKQALCMCMGLGCNAVGVMGCRIIQSPRERMIAILTNAFTPCNGRLPFLMTLITTFLVIAGGTGGRVLSAAALVGLLGLSVGGTLLASYVLSHTVLKGMNSSYVLELPPFRAPKTGQVIVRSVLDRTVYVLMRAVSVAAPAGLLLWILGYVTVDQRSLLQHASGFLDPFGRLLGMDGVILLAFILGFPANEIVLPVALMIYLSQQYLMEPMQVDGLRMVLQQNGWSGVTALCAALFSMFHWPCGTTILTIYKETKHVGWTALAIILPTLTGITICIMIAGVARMF